VRFKAVSAKASTSELGPPKPSFPGYQPSKPRAARPARKIVIFPVDDQKISPQRAENLSAIIGLTNFDHFE
jgi:hypothetical protein